MKDESDLFEAALKVAEHSYSPYSKFRVGAAILCEDGSVITGANVENRSFGLTICAERSALVTAISEGKKSFSAIAIATPDAEYPVSPCGACRQVMVESQERQTQPFEIWIVGRSRILMVDSADRLMPLKFSF